MNVLFPQTNPAMQATIQGAIDPLNRNFQTQTLPLLRESYAMAQPGGGSREGIAEGLAATNLNQQIADTTAQMETAMYGQGLTAQGKALAALPQTQAAQVAPAGQLSAVGGQQDAYTQALLNSIISQYAAKQQAPWTNLANFESLVQGNLGGAGTSSAMGGGSLTSALQNVLGLGLMGMGGYNMAAPLFAGAAGAGAYGAGPYGMASAADLAAYFAPAATTAGAAAGIGGAAAEAAPLLITI
jgi:hypothetical protein